MTHEDARRLAVQLTAEPGVEATEVRRTYPARLKPEDHDVAIGLRAPDGVVRWWIAASPEAARALLLDGG